MVIVSIFLKLPLLTMALLLQELVICLHFVIFFLLRAYDTAKYALSIYRLRVFLLSGLR